MTDSGQEELPLSLLVTWILFVNHVQPAFSPNDLAINTAFFDRCTNFHDAILFISENNPTPCQIIWTHLYSYLVARQDPDVVHPHFSGNGRQYFVVILQLYLEHSVRKCFNNNSILFNECLFCHTDFGSAKIGGII